MEVTNNCSKPAGATKLLHDFPQAFPADSVKGIGKINKCHKEVAVLLLAFLLELLCRKEYVYSSSFHVEVTLTFQEQALFLMLEKAVAHTGHTFPDSGHEGDALMVVARMAVAYPLADVDDADIFQLLRNLAP